ncbi:MAG: hypothetical protein CVU56_16380 [Deltaproteobacteria bacterium HGW-Deltaproteobacteria-14]|nr:MAG: hypothetical protein CVU56_16380 [Deltaproteobacteria bacterium HGW-Deltaproteobacteria-14]
MFGSAVAAALVISGGFASAQFGGIPKPPKVPSVGSGSPSDAQRKAFHECDQTTRKGVDAVPSAAAFSSNAEKRKKDLDRAAELLAKAEAICTPDMRTMSSWDSTGARLEEMRLGVADGQRQLTILERYEPMSKLQKQDVAAADLDDLDARVSAYEAWAPTDDTKRYARNWRTKATQLRAAVEERKAELAGKNAQADRDRAMLVKHDAIDGFDAVLKAMEEHARKAEGPIPAELYEKYEALVAQVESFNPTARQYYEPELRIYRAYDAWLAGDGAADALAKLYEGEVVAQGQSRGKKQSISFAAKKDWCYAILLHFDVAGADSNLDYKDETKMRKVLRFYDDDTLKPWQRLNGLCANEAFKVDLAGPLTFTGTKNVQRYVVVGWARDAFPASLPLRIRPWIDECDPVQYEESYVHPIPGTVNNRQAGDIKKWEPAYASEGQCTLMPGTRTNPDANKFGKCMEALHKRFAPKYAAAIKAKETARTPGAYDAAVKRIQGIDAAKDKDYERSCRPTFEKIRKDFSKAVDRVADAMTGQAYTDHVDRAKRKADEAAGHQRPVNEEGKPDTLSDRDNRRLRMQIFDEHYKGK